MGGVQTIPLNEDLITYLKLQLNIETGYTAEDILLNQYISVSTKSVENFIGYSGTTYEDPVTQGIILFATHLYLNRNIVSFAQGYELPYSFKFLLTPYKNYVVV